MKPRIKSTIQNIRKKKRFDQNNNKKIKFKTMRIAQGDSGTSSNVPTPESEGEEEEQEIENLFEKVMKENFLNLVKEIDMQV